MDKKRTFQQIAKDIKSTWLNVDDNSFVKDKTASFKVIKEFPKHYNSVMFMDELRVANGYIPDNHKRKVY